MSRKKDVEEKPSSLLDSESIYYARPHRTLSETICEFFCRPNVAEFRSDDLHKTFVWCGDIHKLPSDPEETSGESCCRITPLVYTVIVWLEYTFSLLFICGYISLIVFFHIYTSAYGIGILPSILSLEKSLELVFPFILIAGFEMIQFMIKVVFEYFRMLFKANYKVTRKEHVGESYSEFSIWFETLMSIVFFDLFLGVIVFGEADYSWYAFATFLYCKLFFRLLSHFSLSRIIKPLDAMYKMKLITNYANICILNAFLKRIKFRYILKNIKEDENKYVWFMIKSFDTIMHVTLFILQIIVISSSIVSLIYPQYYSFLEMPILIYFFVNELSNLSLQDFVRDLAYKKNKVFMISNTFQFCKRFLFLSHFTILGLVAVIAEDFLPLLGDISNLIIFTPIVFMDFINFEAKLTRRLRFTISAMIVLSTPLLVLGKQNPITLIERMFKIPKINKKEKKEVKKIQEKKIVIQVKKVPKQVTSTSSTPKLEIIEDVQNDMKIEIKQLDVSEEKMKLKQIDKIGLVPIVSNNRLKSLARFNVSIE